MSCQVAISGEVSAQPSPCPSDGTNYIRLSKSKEGWNKYNTIGNFLHILDVSPKKEVGIISKYIIYL